MPGNQRGILFTSYVLNGAVNRLTSVDALKLTQFKPLSVLMWETDETTPYFFNDSSSWPDEGISNRHNKGATVGLLSGSTEHLVVAKWYSNNDQFAGVKGQRGAGIPDALLPNRAWCDPTHPQGGAK